MSTSCARGRSTGRTRGRAQRRGGAHRHPLDGKCWWCTTSSAGRHAATLTSARCSRCTPPRWQGAAQLRRGPGGTLRRAGWTPSPAVRWSPRGADQGVDPGREAGWAARCRSTWPGTGRRRADRGHGGLVVGAIGISGAAERILDGKGHPDRGSSSMFGTPLARCRGTSGRQMVTMASAKEGPDGATLRDVDRPGHHSTRCMLFDRRGQLLSVAHASTSSIPPAGWWSTTRLRSGAPRQDRPAGAARPPGGQPGRGRAGHRQPAGDHRAVDRHTGQPIRGHRLAGHPHRRAGHRAGRPARRGPVPERCGLPLATYFSAPGSAGC